MHNVLVVLNKRAGALLDRDPAEVRREVESALRVGGRSIEVVLERGQGIVRAVERGAAGGYDTLIVGGGDGSVSCAADRLAGKPVALGVLPLGTLNHFAKDARIPLDLEAAVATVVAAHVTSVDVGEVNGRPFVNNASIGIYPDIAVEREKLRKQGYRKWIAFALATAQILRRYRGLVVRLAADDATLRARTAFLFVGNNEYDTDGLDLGARARLDGGRLVAYFAPRVHARDLPKLLALALAGRAKERHALESVAASELHVHTPGRHRLRVALDGEVTVMARPLRFRIRPQSLRVIVPAS
jgi:diacylglycerol kinase family enzyme